MTFTAEDFQQSEFTEEGDQEEEFQSEPRRKDEDEDFRKRSEMAENEFRIMTNGLQEQLQVK